MTISVKRDFCRIRLSSCWVLPYAWTSYMTNLKDWYHIDSVPDPSLWDDSLGFWNPLLVFFYIRFHEMPIRQEQSKILWMGEVSTWQKVSIDSADF